MDAFDTTMEEEVNKIVKELGCTVEVDDTMHVFDQLVFTVTVLYKVKTKRVNNA